MEHQKYLELLRARAARQLALELFVKCCNTRHTLFIGTRWFEPRRQTMLARLSDPITEDQAKVIITSPIVSSRRVAVRSPDHEARAR